MSMKARLKNRLSMIANCSIVQAKILTSLSALTFFAALFTFLICTLTIKIYTQAHWSTIPTKTAKSEIFPCRRSRVCELWSHFNPTVEKRWQWPLPLQRLWLVVIKIPSVNFSCQHYQGNLVSKI